MHPAISVIFFTVTSGAGFGFIALLGLGVPMPGEGIPAFVACLIAGGLASAGLISSTFHLGHPERAWRAFSQWRSSWLSREGVCAVMTLFAFGFYAFSWVFFGERVLWLGIIVAIGSIATVFTTSMIYAQLKTVPSWNNWMTPVCYLLFAAASGALLVASFGHWINVLHYPVSAIVLSLTVVAWGMKGLWWRKVAWDTLSSRGSDTGTATGLGQLGKVRLLERPHSGENYLTKEMVHKIARKHASRLKVLSILLGAFIPILLCFLAILSELNSLIFAVSFIFLLAGLFIERWLFFAEAKHAVSLYYD